MNYAAFRKSVLIIPLRPCCAVESSLQNAGLVDTTTRGLENQLTRMGFITIQQLLIAQRRCETLDLYGIVDKVGFFMQDRVLQYRMPLLESAAKLTDDFATQHVENAAGGPHYNLRECGLQLLYFSAHVGPANTHMTATL